MKECSWVCPRCQTPLQEEKTGWWCDKEDLLYPTEDGVVILLSEAAISSDLASSGESS